MKSKINFLFAGGICLMALSCGHEKNSSSLFYGGLVLDIVFPETLSAIEAEDLRRKIEIYRFQFRGSFPEIEPIEVESKKYSQYVFSNIPYDTNLHIFLEALSGDHQIVYCEGEENVNFHETKEDRVIIVLRCL